MDIETINTINAEERQMEKEGAYDLHHEDLHNLPYSQEDIITNLINGEYVIEGVRSDWHDANMYYTQLVERKIDTYEASLALSMEKYKEQVW